MEDTLYIVMPAYNEGDNIMETVESWMPVLNGKSGKSRLVIADSGSTDNTHELLLGLKKKYSKLEILEKTNQYHGPKVIALYKYAIKKGADYIFQTDSDGQTNPAEFESFWEKREDFDAILGYRNKRGDGKVRAFVEKIVCLLLRLFFSVRVPDANAPFRLMKASLVDKYIDNLPNEYDLPNIMLTAYFARFNEKITFETVSFKPRAAGANSINLKKIFRIGKESLFAFMKFRKDMKKADPENARNVTKHKIGSLAIALSFIGAAFLAISVSPSSPWNRGETVTDSGVFLTVGTQMKSGLTPYLDTFDHKGPVLYIINFLGVLINPMSGILIFEFLALLIAVAYMYKIARLMTSKRAIAWFLTMAVFSLYFTLNVIDRGNLTEEYAFPLIAMALYEFMKYLLRGETSLFRIFMVGIGFACVLMLRVNMVAIWGVFGVAILVKMIIEKKNKELFKFALVFFSGVLTVVIPILLWLGLKGALSSFVDVYIKFNSEYTKTGIMKAFSTISYIFGYSLVLFSLGISCCCALMEKNKKEKFALWSFVVAFVVAIAMASMSGRNFPHYVMVLIPLVIFPFAKFYESIGNSATSRGLVIIVSVFIVSLTYQAWFSTLSSVMSSFRNRREGEPIPILAKTSCGVVEENTDEGDKIIVYGNLDYIYLRCNRLPASRYSFQYPIAEVRPSILDEFFNEVAKNQPKVFIVQGGYVDERVVSFLNGNGYKEVWRDIIIDEITSKENPNTSRIYVLKGD
ncbi:glycosyltransferase [Candidatus Saccharibacteria bacterium]|nr:glycosyltransferase [Candidatus Saccharibacteria bacterium]